MKPILVVLVTLLSLGLTRTQALARGQNVSLEPSQTALLPSDESGVTRVAIRFDVSQLPTGTHRVITRALVEWTVSGLTAQSECNIYGYPILQSWTAEGAASGRETVEAGEVEVAVWAVEPPDYARRGGYVRLDLLDLVRDWEHGGTANHGVVITFSDIDRGDLGQVLNTARLNMRLGVDE